MEAIINQVNSIGLRFVDFAVAGLVQSSALIVVLLVADVLLHKKVRATVRYCLWILVLVKLILPISLTSPVSVGNLVGNKLTAAQINEIFVSNESLSETAYYSEGFESDDDADALTYPARPLSAEISGQETVAKSTNGNIVSVTWQGAVFLGWLVIAGAMVLLLLQRAIFVCGLVRQAKQANTIMNDNLEFCRK